MTPGSEHAAPPTGTPARTRGIQRVRALARRVLHPLRHVWPRSADAALGLLALGVVGLTLLTFSPAVTAQTIRFTTGNKLVAYVYGMLNPFRTQHALLDSGLPVYDLRIATRNLSQVEAAVQAAVKRGWMSEEDRLTVPGTFFAEGQRYDVNVRLRGDLPNHWTEPKKSWRINFGSNEVTDALGTRKEASPFHGRDQINLIIPGDRDFAVAAFVNDLMRDEGLVVPRDQFVVLRLNGRLQGLYYEVEHFDNPLFAAYERPETTVFGQNDRAMHFDQYTKLGAAGAADARFDLASLRRLVDEAGDLGLPGMRVLLEHELDPTPERFRQARAVLDWDKYLTFRALTTLLNTNHVRLGSDNLRLYHDPSRGLLEPVPWDAHVVRMPPEPGTIDYWNNHGADELQKATLSDPALRLQRNQILWRWLEDGGDALIARYDAIHDRIRPAAWLDVLSSPTQALKMDALRADLVYNVRRAHKVLALSSANAVYRLLASDRAALDVTSTNFSGVQLAGVTLQDPALLRGTYRLVEDLDGDGQAGPADRAVAMTQANGGTVHFDLSDRVLPEVNYRGDIIEDRYWEFMETLGGRRHYLVLGRLAAEPRDPLTWAAPAITVTASNAVTGAAMQSGLVDGEGASPEGTVGVLAYDASDPFDVAAPERNLAEFLAASPQFRRSQDSPGAAELAGTVTITGTVIVPKAVPLVLRPGADVTMAPGASVVAYGGLNSVGTPDEPVRIHGDASGRPWGTFAVVRPPSPVVVRHTEFADGGQAQVNGLLFTGGFAVYDGDLELDHARFVDMQSEDSLNLKNGHLDMRHSLVARSASDGIDVDFGTGQIADSRFETIAGDAMDLSGSTITISRTVVDGAGDKCISVGEASAPVIVNNLLKGCVIGVATKDLSNAMVLHNTFVDNQLAVQAIRKKPMFGGGQGDFVANVFAGNQRMLEEDSFSRGGARLSRSLTDRPVRCERCREVTEVPFQAPGRGDYRLAPAGLDGSLPTADAATWLAAGQEAAPPALPGVYGALSAGSGP